MHLCQQLMRTNLQKFTLFSVELLGLCYTLATVNAVLSEVYKSTAMFLHAFKGFDKVYANTFFGYLSKFSTTPSTLW